MSAGATDRRSKRRATVTAGVRGDAAGAPGGATAVRSRLRTADKSGVAPLKRRRTYLDAGLTPYCHRRLVDERIHEGDRATLRSLRCRTAFSAARPAYPIWGFCALATGVPCRGCARPTCCLLVQPARRCRSIARASCRPGASRKADVPRRDSASPVFALVEGPS